MKTHYVDMEGVMEVRTVYDDKSYVSDSPDDLPIDLLALQNNPGLDNLSEDYCAKDRTYGVQRVFYCLACDCDMKSWISLDSHAGGSKHAKKVVELKRMKQGLPAQEPPETKKTKVAKQRVRPDRHRTLREKLEDRDVQGIPILGLECITEFVSPSHPDRPHFYTCSLEGCKSAWGDSNDMFHHVCSKTGKHSKNYIVHVLKDVRGLALNKAEVLARSIEVDAKLRDEKNRRKYDMIRLVEDEEAYKEISTRPDDWSEAKANGTASTSSSTSNASNANLVPLGIKRARKEGRETPPVSTNGHSRDTASSVSDSDDDGDDSWRPPWMVVLSDKDLAEQFIQSSDEVQDEIAKRLTKLEASDVAPSRIDHFVDLTRDCANQHDFAFKFFVRSSGKTHYVQSDLDRLKDNLDQLSKDVDRITNQALFKVDLMSYVAYVLTRTLNERPEYRAIVRNDDEAAALANEIGVNVCKVEVNAHEKQKRPWNKLCLTEAMKSNVSTYVDKAVLKKYRHFVAKPAAAGY